MPNKTVRQTKYFLLRALNRWAAERKELFGHPPLGCDKGCYQCQAREAQEKAGEFAVFLGCG